MINNKYMFDNSTQNCSNSDLVSVCVTYMIVLGLRGVLCAIICLLILTLDPWTHRTLKKTWVDIPDMVVI